MAIRPSLLVDRARRHRAPTKPSDVISLSRLCGRPQIHIRCADRAAGGGAGRRGQWWNENATVWTRRHDMDRTEATVDDDPGISLVVRRTPTQTNAYRNECIGLIWRSMLVIYVRYCCDSNLITQICVRTLFTTRRRRPRRQRATPTENGGLENEGFSKAEHRSLIVTYVYHKFARR